MVDKLEEGELTNVVVVLVVGTKSVVLELLVGEVADKVVVLVGGTA